MLSESSWDRGGIRRQLVADANAHFGHPCALVIDESAIAKKGTKSAGVARQWNGRLGKTDNSQVGVFAAVTRDRLAALVDSELFVPEIWLDDPARCREAGMPEGLEFRTKGEMALDMIYRLRREGLHFAYTAFDAGYGHLPWLLRALDDEQEIFLLSCNDLVEIMRHKLPCKIETDADLVASIENRHRTMRCFFTATAVRQGSCL